MTIPLQFASLYDGQQVFVWSDCLLDLGTDFLVGNNYGLCMRCVVSCGSTSFPWLVSCFLLWSSAVRVHDSQACRKMDVTRECINHILELREILLSFQTGFNHVNAAVVCVILESILGLEPLSVITEPRHLKLATVSSFYPFTVISVLISSALSSWH